MRNRRKSNRRRRRKEEVEDTANELNDSLYLFQFYGPNSLLIPVTLNCSLRVLSLRNSGIMVTFMIDLQVSSPC